MYDTHFYVWDNSIRKLCGTVWYDFVQCTFTFHDGDTHFHEGDTHFFLSDTQKICDVNYVVKYYTSFLAFPVTRKTFRKATFEAHFSIPNLTYESLLSNRVIHTGDDKLTNYPETHVCLYFQYPWFISKHFGWYISGYIFRYQHLAAGFFSRRAI